MTTSRPVCTAVSTATDHYRAHLSAVYVWMAGGFNAAVARGHAELNGLCPKRTRGLTAVDLGAGFGTHAVPLALRGYSVLAIDTSAALLKVLRGHASALTVRTVEDDLLNFQTHLSAKADLIVCMGDTLTHLSGLRSIEDLFSRVSESLRVGGKFITTFRDYSQPLAGTTVIPVRCDADRILTCFLEYAPNFVTVHDVLHERRGSVWHLRVSAYQKTRVAFQWASDALEARGFSVRVDAGTDMGRIVATRL